MSPQLTCRSSFSSGPQLMRPGCLRSFLPQAAWSLGHFQVLAFESVWLKLSVPAKHFVLTIVGTQVAIARESLFQKTGVCVRQEHC